MSLGRRDTSLCATGSDASIYFALRWFSSPGFRDATNERGWTALHIRICSQWNAEQRAKQRMSDAAPYSWLARRCLVDYL